LAGVWADVLRLERVGVHDNFFELGGDSILTIQVISRARDAGLVLTPRQFFQHQTVSDLARVAQWQVARAVDQGPVTGEVDLTPIQRWFFDPDPVDAHHFNQSQLFEVPATLDVTALSHVATALLAHHDALRLRFERKGWQWRQTVAAVDVESPPVDICDLANVPEPERDTRKLEKMAEVQASLDLTAGPLVRFLLIDSGEARPKQLLVVIHHLAIDGVSWRILIEDFQTALAQIEAAQPIELPAKSTSYQDWAAKLEEYASSELLAAEMDYWLSVQEHSTAALPTDDPAGANLESSAETISCRLPAAETHALLFEIQDVYHTQINDVLLTALVEACAAWTGRRSLVIDLEGHGREDLFDHVDLSRTVGWFTTIFPVYLDLTAVDAPGEAIKAIKEQLRSIPNRGIGYGVLRYLSPDQQRQARLKAAPPIELSFNYLGQFDPPSGEAVLLRRLDADTGPAHSQRANRRHVLAIDALVTQGELRVDFTFSRAKHQRETIETFAGRFVDALRLLIRHCQTPQAGGYTPSDFSKVELSQTDLDDLVAELGDVEEDES